MKLSLSLLALVASTDPDPLQRLNTLTQLTEELLNDHFSFLPSKDKWINRFARNGDRIKYNYEKGTQRCGFYDKNQLSLGGARDRRIINDEEFTYDTEDPKIGTAFIFNFN